MDAVIFDLDGVLVDTHDLIVKAYARVGVEMPVEAHGRPWHEWLIEVCGGNLNKAEVLHNRKNEKYAEMISDIEVLPPIHLLMRLEHEGVKVGVITGAARVSAEAILKQKLGKEINGLLLATGCNIAEKMHILRTLPYHRIVYVDDMPAPANWRTNTGTAYVQYTGQDLDTIEKKVRSAWMQ